MIGRNLFAFRQNKLISIIIQNKYLSLPYLINFTGDYFTDPVFILDINIILFKIENPCCKILS